MCVLNHFLPQMTSVEVENAAFINVSNENLESDTPDGGQLFFASILAFKDMFTKRLPANVGHRITSINVKTDFNRIDAPDSQIESSICH